MFCPKCGNDMGENRFCQKCGFDSEKEHANVIEKREYTPRSQVYAAQKKKNSGCLIFFIIAIVVIAIAVFAMAGAGNSGGNSASGYMSIDREQATEENYKNIVSFMDTYLEERGMYPMSYSVEWIGYHKYKNMYSVEEYEDFALGGYYSYTATLSTGELASASVKDYCNDDVSPEVLSLTVETDQGANEIVPYDNEKMIDCWDLYFQKHQIRS